MNQQRRLHVPAQAGTHSRHRLPSIPANVKIQSQRRFIPAFAGMTEDRCLPSPKIVSATLS